MSGNYSLKIDQGERTGGVSINGIPVLKLDGDSMKIKDIVYEITPEIHKALSSTGYTGETMKSENDNLMVNNILGDVNYTDIRDITSNKKNILCDRTS